MLNASCNSAAVVGFIAVWLKRHAIQGSLLRCAVLVAASLGVYLVWRWTQRGRTGLLERLREGRQDLQRGHAELQEWL